MIPDVHLTRQGSDLDDGLTQEVVTLPGQLLPQPRLQVVVLVPDPHLDPVTRVVTFEWKLLVPFRIQFLGNGFCTFLCFSNLYCYIWIAGPSLIFGNETLSTYNWNTQTLLKTFHNNFSTKIFRTVEQQMNELRTCNLNLAGPLGGSVENNLFWRFKIGSVRPWVNIKHGPKSYKLVDNINYNINMQSNNISSLFFLIIRVPIIRDNKWCLINMDLISHSEEQTDYADSSYWGYLRTFMYAIYHHVNMKTILTFSIKWNLSFWNVNNICCDWLSGNNIKTTLIVKTTTK